MIYYIYNKYSLYTRLICGSASKRGLNPSVCCSALARLPRGHGPRGAGGADAPGEDRRGGADRCRADAGPSHRGQGDHGLHEAGGGALRLAAGRLHPGGELEMGAEIGRHIFLSNRIRYIEIDIS